MPSKRVQQIEESGIRKMFALAKKIDHPCDLSLGQPDFDVPEPIKEAAIHAIRSGRNGYTQTQGIDPLVKKISQRYADRGIPQEDVCVTSAVTGGFLLALLATCDPGDEIIVPDPYFTFWDSLPKLFGVKPVTVDTYPDFRWRKEKLEAAISPRTRAIALASPSNPTGIAATEEELRLIAQVAQKHNLWVIYDEIYELFNYDFPHLDMARFYPKTITLSGFSKSHGMSGWRIGAAAGPRSIIQQMLKLQQFSFICVPQPAQWAAITALDVNMDSQVAHYRRKRDYVVEQLSSLYEITACHGAFYLFIKAPPGYTGESFAQKALEEKLIVVPGNVFSQKNSHFRISFATSDANLERGVEILRKLATAAVFKESSQMSIALT